jgi:hypothetical protein
MHTHIGYSLTCCYVLTCWYYIGMLVVLCPYLDMVLVWSYYYTCIYICTHIGYMLVWLCTCCYSCLYICCVVCLDLSLSLSIVWLVWCWLMSVFMLGVCMFIGYHICACALVLLLHLGHVTILRVYVITLSYVMLLLICVWLCDRTCLRIAYLLITWWFVYVLGVGIGR